MLDPLLQQRPSKVPVGAGNSVVGVDQRLRPPDPGAACIAFCTGSSPRWLASQCANHTPGVRRTSRSSCCATNSACSAARSTAPPSTTATGACSARSQPGSPAHAVTAGSSRPTRSCAGTAAASPPTGPNHSDHRADPPHRRSCGDSSWRWPPRTRHGATGESTANSSASAIGWPPRRSGRPSAPPASTPHPNAPA